MRKVKPSLLKEELPTTACEKGGEGDRSVDDLEENAKDWQIGVAIVGYSICSSTMLLANKLVMSYDGMNPGMVSVIQIVFATLAVGGLKATGAAAVDDFDTAKLKRYALYIGAFVTAIFANMKALHAANVETVIVFKALTPLAVAAIDYLYMGREFPSVRSMAAMTCVGFGAVVYCMADSQLALEGIQAYSWVSVYFVLIVFEMTYGKSLTSTVKMKSVWGPVLYTNTLAILPMATLGWVAGDFGSGTAGLRALSWNGWGVLMFSCVTGTLIGYTSWLTRGMVSATTFTLVGVVNKFLTILLNVMVWDKHSSPKGLFAVCFCLLAGVFYQQAKKRDTGPIGTK